MSINERLIAALSPLGFPVVPDLYTGEEPVYLTFNYDIVGALFAEDAPQMDRYLVQVHLFAPFGRNLVGTRRQIRRLLLQAGFTWPDVVDAGAATASEQDVGQHIVFECELEEGVMSDGETVS